MLAVPDPDQPCGLVVSVVQLAHQSCSVVAELLTATLASLELFDMALVEAQEQLLQLLPNRCDGDSCCMHRRSHAAGRNPMHTWSL